MSAIKIATQPVCEPVSLAEAKLWARVDADLTADDTLISALISAAREWASVFTGRALINTEFVQYHNKFPISGGHWGTRNGPIKLLRSPLQAVKEIRYLDTAGDWQELAPQDLLASPPVEGDFEVGYANEPPLIFPHSGESWPTTFDVPNAVEIHYTAGYNDEAAILAAVEAYADTSPAPSDDEVTTFEYGLRRADPPVSATTAMKMLIAYWYENREAAAGATGGTDVKALPLSMQSLLWSMRVYDFNPTP